MAEEIVKVQLPLRSNDPKMTANTALIYPEDRTRQAQQSIPPDIARMVAQKGMKAYYYAKYEKGRWNLTRPAANQPW